MKRKLFAALLILGISLAGCGSKSLVRDSFTFPAIGQLTIRGVGESLLEQGSGLLAPELELAQDVIIGKSKIMKGRYEYVTEDKRGRWFTDSAKDFYVNHANQVVCIDSNECIMAKFTISMKLAPNTLSSNSFQQTLLYNGRFQFRSATPGSMN